MLRFVSLFAGIGGIDLGLERAGHECVGQVELDDYATRVLEKHWPDTPRIRDVRDFHGTEFGPFDLLTGGYPCQPFSVAGNRQGDLDDRHLWPEVLRIIRAVRPRYVLLENVPGHLSLGFGRVLGDLAESGYSSEWDCIPASAVGAPHRRDRVWIVAYPNRERSHAGATHQHGELVPDEHGFNPQPATGRRQLEPRHSGGGEVADAASGGRRPWRSRRPVGEHPGLRDAACTLAHADGPGREEQHAATLTSRPGLRTWRLTEGRRQWAVEPGVGRVVNGVPHRVDRLRGLGNAVVPNVAEWIGRRLPVTP